MKIIKNSKIILKPFEEVHLADFVEAIRESVGSVGIWMSWCHAEYSKNDARLWFESCGRNIDNKSAYDIGIFLAQTGQLVGGVAINRIDYEHQIGNIGYWVRESFQNQGIASCAMGLIKQFGFGCLGLTRLEIIVLEANNISRKVAEKSGAKFEWLAKNRLVHDGQPTAAMIYSLLP
ncbi:GNAT family N-acetyltransferase [Beggiatoa alba]|nr:GNAT family N-acetyltransferase [Beggiatoa alba]